MLKKTKYFGCKIPIFSKIEESDEWLDKRRKRWDNLWIFYTVIVFIPWIYLISIRRMNMSFFEFAVPYLVSAYLVGKFIRKYRPRSNESSFRVVSVDEESQTATILIEDERNQLPLAIIDNYPAYDIINTPNNYLVSLKIQAYGEEYTMEFARVDRSITGSINWSNIIDEVNEDFIIEFIDDMTKFAFPIIMVNQFLFFDFWTLIFVAIPWGICWNYNDREAFIKFMSSESWRETSEFSNVKIFDEEQIVTGEIIITRKNIFDQDIFRKVSFVDKFEKLENGKIRIFIRDSVLDFSVKIAQQ